MTNAEYRRMNNDDPPVTWASLTNAQRLALLVAYDAGQRGCWTTSRGSKGRYVNYRAASSLRRFGLVRFSAFDLHPERVMTTVSGRRLLLSVARTVTAIGGASGDRPSPCKRCQVALVSIEGILACPDCGPVGAPRFIEAAAR